jgi:hypothetical protein
MAKDSYDWLIYPAIVAGGFGALYLIFKPTAEPERLPVATPGGAGPKPAPLTVGAVSAQFDTMTEKFYAQEITAGQAAEQISRLMAALEDMWNRGVGDRTAITSLVTEMDRFLKGLSPTLVSPA